MCIDYRIVNGFIQLSPLFFFFMPVALWYNNYKHEQLEARVEAYITRRNKIQHRHPEDTTSIRTPRDVRMSLMDVQPVLPHELCVFIGLLLTRAIQPNREKISNNWKMSDEGGIAKGVFGNYMPRDRFMEISRNLHFSSNLDPRAKTDRAWKIRKVVHVLQRTFRRGYTPPAELAFDEAMLPSRSSFNTTRVYMKDKPCKWGTELFMLCSAHTAYCISYDTRQFYVGKKQHTSDTKSIDKKSGPAAVVRNLKAAFPEGLSARSYGSILHKCGACDPASPYAVGTTMPNRIGFANSIKEKRKTRPQEIMRGSFKYFQQGKGDDGDYVVGQQAGSDLALDLVIRREKTGERHEVACPKAVKDYHKYMVGVGVHDQLRLQRYSLQRAVIFRKYYKSLFLGLVDLAIVNGYIVHRAHHAAKSTRPLTHVQYIRKLHLELINLKGENMYEGNTFGADPPQSLVSTNDPPSSISASSGNRGDHPKHSAKQVHEWRNPSGQLKRVQRNCKVCSLHRTGGKRGGTTTYFCDACYGSLPVYICMKPKHTVEGVLRSCWDIWHSSYKNGTGIPENLQGKIKLRQSPAKRRHESAEEEKAPNA
ncbi:LOW QUALITY PROTEIN: Hypothetical protein PHPALM_6802 [Phytophthora palmivora]|uniref:PiggyBac transposable element-derived protein domain-containing protein n=1 Tax=Phytophthora palmivora TaxID=4796 RepID=A0A2P4YDW8_9STRA|nr:LOW QUALITY PROTEIN: Hypothetical protein PHPALM_6802 [Phytophthora palmivora]